MSTHAIIVPNSNVVIILVLVKKSANSIYLDCAVAEVYDAVEDAGEDTDPGEDHPEEEGPRIVVTQAPIPEGFCLVRRDILEELYRNTANWHQEIATALGVKSQLSTSDRRVLPPVAPDQVDCGVCGAKCRDNAKLKIHMRIHDHSAKYYCESCDRHYSKKYSYDNHPCFKAMSYMVCELQARDGARNLLFNNDGTIKKCMAKISNKAAMGQHILNQHQDSLDLSCPFVGCTATGFPTKRQLTEHKDRCQYSTKPLLDCYYKAQAHCNKQFRTKKSLDYHMKKQHAHTTGVKK